MSGLLSLSLDQTRALFQELFKSPLSFPLVVIFLWRGSNRTLGPTISPVIGVLAIFFFEPALRAQGPWLSWMAPTTFEFLDPQVWVSSMLRSQSMLVFFAEQLNPGWHLENFMVSGRTASFAFLMFSALLIRLDQGMFRGFLQFIGLVPAVAILTSILVFVYMLGAAPFQNADMATVEEAARIARRALEYLARVPELAAASAMLLCMFAGQAVSYLRSATTGLPPALILLNVIYPCLILGGSILGFGLLSFWQGLLFLLFLIVGYPICLAFTRSDVADATLVKRYSLGIEQLLEIFRYKGGFL